MGKYTPVRGRTLQKRRVAISGDPTLASFECNLRLLACHRVISLPVAYVAATIESLRAALLRHAWLDAMRLVSLLCITERPALELIWKGGCAALFGLLRDVELRLYAAETASASPADVSRLKSKRAAIVASVIDFYHRLRNMESSGKLRRQLVLEQALFLVRVRRLDDALNLLRNESSRAHPLLDGLHAQLLLLLRMQSPRRKKSDADAYENEEDDDDDDELVIEKATTTTTTAAASAASSADHASQILDGLLRLPPLQPMFLPCAAHAAHLRDGPGGVLALAMRMRATLPATCTELLSVYAPHHVRDYTASLASVVPAASTLLEENDMLQNAAPSSWRRLQDAERILEPFNFPNQTVARWHALLSFMASDSEAKDAVIQIISRCKSWWFTLHLGRHYLVRNTSVLGYTCIVAFLAVRPHYERMKESIWFGRDFPRRVERMCARLGVSVFDLVGK